MTVTEQLRTLDVCAVSDAIDALGGSTDFGGVASGLKRLTTDRTIAGRVRTMRLENAAGRTASVHLGAESIDTAEPGEVIVVEHHDRADCAGWGGLLSAAAQVRGLSGVIVDGMCRDVDEGEAAGFPVFACGAVPKTARSRIIQTGRDCPVTIGGIPVKPGDYVIADGSGVVFVAEEKASLVIEKAMMIAERERKMAEAIRSGIPVSRVMSGDYEGMLR